MIGLNSWTQELIAPSLSQSVTDEVERDRDRELERLDALDEMERQNQLEGPFEPEFVQF